jgi:exopolysaccharide production protein ExoQ
MASSMTHDLDAKFVNEKSRERPFLIAMFLLIYISYGALGRDIFFNHLNSATASSEDPIGRVLPYIRVTTCILSFLVITMSAGLTWTISKIPLMFMPFCVLALASSVWSDNPKQTLSNALMVTAMWLALPPIIHRIGLAQAMKSSLLLISAVVIISAALALLMPSIGTHTGTEFVQAVHAGRWRGIFAHKNGLGPWAAYGSIFLFTHSKFVGGPRLYWWVARLCALLCLIFSGSATSIALTAFILGTWFGFMLLRRQKLSIILTIAFFLGIMGILIIVFLQDFVFALLQRDANLTGRTQIWQIADGFFWQRPWFGSGYQTLGGEAFLNQILLTFLQPIPGPESGYYCLLMELGIFGIAFFFVPFWASIKNGLEWLKYVRIQDRAAIEFFLTIQLSTLVLAVSETNALVSTGFDGVIAFTGLFALLTTPKSPDQRLKGEFRLAKYWTKPQYGQK